MILRRAVTSVVVCTLVGLASWSLPTAAQAATMPRISIGSASVVEGQMTRRYVKFVVTLSRPSAVAVSVQYNTSDDTATVGNIDYKAKSGTLVFTAGQTSKGTAVVVWPDRDDENDEQFMITLSNPMNADLGVDTGVGTIFDDDPNVGPRVAIGDATINETCSGPKVSAVVVVTMSIFQAVSVTVRVTSAPDTAQPGIDFLDYNKTITFSADQTLKEVKIAVLPDQVAEGSETLTLNLEVLAGPVPVSRSTGTVSILDCDPN